MRGPQLGALDAMLADAPTDLDLGSSEQLEWAREAADRLLSDTPDLPRLRRLEERLIVEETGVPLLAHLSIKLACSKATVKSIRTPCTLSVVFAMYKETARLQRRSVDPHGEDLLRCKIEQLDWLVEDSDRLSWRLYAVDDGCPDGSGAIARQIAQELGRSEQVRVLFLEEAVARGEPALRPLRSTFESQKGGSILYGMWRAALESHPGDVVLFTDADLSTDLGQSGLLLEPLLARRASCAIGSRRETLSVVVKRGRRDVRGRLFIYLWRRLLPILGAVVDTQCGFKAFRADSVAPLVTGTQERRFAFDIELLLRTALAGGGAIVTVPIAWIDSEASSTTTDLEPYLPMLRSVVGFYRRYLPGDPQADRFAIFIESLDEQQWRTLVDRVPAEIADSDPVHLGLEAPVGVSDLELLVGR